MWPRDMEVGESGEFPQLPPTLGVFRRFLIQSSMNFHEILQVLLENLDKFESSISKFRQFDM